MRKRFNSFFNLKKNLFSAEKINGGYPTQINFPRFNYIVPFSAGPFFFLYTKLGPPIPGPNDHKISCDQRRFNWHSPLSPPGKAATQHQRFEKSHDPPLPANAFASRPIRRCGPWRFTKNPLCVLFGTRNPADRWVGLLLANALTHPESVGKPRWGRPCRPVPGWLKTRDQFYRTPPAPGVARGPGFCVSRDRVP